MIAKSAEAVTRVLALAVLFAGKGSAVADETEAVSDMLAACTGAVTTTAIVGAVAAAASAGRVHVIEALAALMQVHPAPVAATNVTPAGSVSVTETPAASDGPLSTTTRAYVTVPPATTLAGPVLVRARSARALTPVTTDEVLFPGAGSAVVDATEAVFDRDPA